MAEEQRIGCLLRHSIHLIHSESNFPLLPLDDPNVTSGVGGVTAAMGRVNVGGSGSTAE